MKPPRLCPSKMTWPRLTSRRHSSTDSTHCASTLVASLENFGRELRPKPVQKHNLCTPMWETEGFLPEAPTVYHYQENCKRSVAYHCHIADDVLCCISETIQIIKQKTSEEYVINFKLTLISQYAPNVSSVFETLCLGNYCIIDRYVVLNMHLLTIIVGKSSNGGKTKATALSSRQSRYSWPQWRWDCRGLMMMNNH
jgi:hypothetical protein